MVQATPKDLDKPLGQDRGGQGVPAGRRALRFILVWGVGLAAVLLFGGYLLLGPKPEGGPEAVASIAAPAPDAPPTPSRSPEATAAEPAAQANRTPAAQIEQRAGVAVVRPAGDVPGAIIITVPDAADSGLPPAPDPRVTLHTAKGPLPRIGEDGSRPAEVYARPAPPQAAMAPARVAVVIDGLGLSEAATRQAIETLPADVTLALAATGSGLADAAAAARRAGHEIMLSVAGRGLDADLSGAMARFSGYAGILAVADAQNLAAVRREAGERGLLLLATGGSGGARAGLVSLDASMPAEAVEQAFARAEREAQRAGSAIIVAQASPSLLRQLARWTESLERRGILLLPASALIASQKG